MAISLSLGRQASPAYTDMAAYEFGGDKAPDTSSISQKVQNAFWGVIDTFAPVNQVSGERQFLTLIPESWEIALGKYVHKIEVAGKGLSYNKAVVNITERACKRIAEVTDRKLPYEVQVVDSAVINAFCCPGGYMVMNRGLVEAMMNCKDDFGLGPIPLEDKVAAIMAHESVHAAARHGARGIEFALFATGFLFIAATVAQYALRAFADKENVPSKKTAADAAADVIEWVYNNLGNIIFKLWRASFSRENEDQSDKFGMVYLQRAGYDPKAMIWAMKFLAKSEIEFPIPWLHHVTDWFRSHDHADNRAKKCEKTAEDLAAGKIPVSPTSVYGSAAAAG